MRRQAAEQNKIEILAPAGSMESLQAAVFAGADAVYLGHTSFSARKNARNFDDGSLAEAAAFCRERGCKVYLALNTLLSDEEIPLAWQVLNTAAKAGVDAVILQDLSVYALIKKYFPHFALHASTQMSVSNLWGVNMLKQMGFSRVVLAREMSREQIAHICGQSEMETEVFVHGALCMSVSGQCYLSSVLGGRSGNRGLCAQPCRLDFSYAGGQKVLSLKDLSLLAHVQEMEKMGVSSLKIEGRMKRPEYVYAAVLALKHALQGRHYDIRQLQSVFSRSGFTCGYYTAKIGRELFGFRRKEDVQAAEKQISALTALCKKEVPRVHLSGHFSLTSTFASFTVKDDQCNTSTVRLEENILSKEKGQEDFIRRQLSKTGATPYLFTELVISAEPGFGLGAAQLNAMRRQALEEISGRRRQIQPVTCQSYVPPQEDRKTAYTVPQWRGRFSFAGQIPWKQAHCFSHIILPLGELLNAWPTLLPYKEKLVAEMPFMSFGNTAAVEKALEKAKALGVQAAMAKTIGDIEVLKRHGFFIYGDYSLNIFNTSSALEYEKLGVCDITCSFECLLQKAKAISCNAKKGILFYGRLPLMVMRNCLGKAFGEGKNCKTCATGSNSLIDRQGKRFPLMCGGECGILLNSDVLYLADRQLACTGFDFYTFYFTLESPAECENILMKYQQQLPAEEGFTRGLYFRKIL